MIGRPLKNPAAGFGDKELQLWYDRLNRGIRRRKDEETRWKHNEKFEDLKQWGGKLGEDDDVTINKVGSFIKARTAAIAYKNPKFKLTPIKNEEWQAIPVPITDPQKGPMIDEQGQQMMRPVFKHKVCEGLINFIISQPAFGFNATIRRLIKAAYIGYGVIKVGYRADFEDLPVDPKNEQMIPIGPDGTPDFSSFLTDEMGNLIEDEDGRWIKQGAEPTSENWFIDWTHYRNMIIDPEGQNDFFQHGWVAYEYLRPVREVKKDRNYKNTKGLESTGDSMGYEDRPKPDYAPTENLDPYVKEYSEQIRLFEVWDFDKNRVIVLADGHGKKLRDEPIPLGIGHSPYVFLRLTEKLGEFYPRPPVSDLAPINDEYNKYRKQQLIQMRKSSRKMLIGKNVLDTEGVEQLTSPEDMAVVQVDVPEGVPLESVITHVPIPNVSADVFAYGSNISKDFDEVAGQPGEQRGFAASKTATQAEIMAHGESVREDDDRNILATALREAGKKLLDSIQANMTVPLAVAIEGEDGQVFQTMVDRDMILGDFDLEVDITEMMPRRPELMQARFVQVLQVAGQAPWLFANEQTAAPIFEAFQITDPRFVEGVVQGAQLQMMMLMAPSQPEKPDAKPAKNRAEQRSQDAGAKK